MFGDRARVRYTGRSIGNTGLSHSADSILDVRNKAREVRTGGNMSDVQVSMTILVLE